MPQFSSVIENSKREERGPIKIVAIFALLDSSGTDAGIDIGGEWDVLRGVFRNKGNKETSNDGNERKDQTSNNQVDKKRHVITCYRVVWTEMSSEL